MYIIELGTARRFQKYQMCACLEKNLRWKKIVHFFSELTFENWKNLIQDSKSVDFCDVYKLKTFGIQIGKKMSSKWGYFTPKISSSGPYTNYFYLVPLKLIFLIQWSLGCIKVSLIWNLILLFQSQLKYKKIEERACEPFCPSLRISNYFLMRWSEKRKCIINSKFMIWILFNQDVEK